MGQILVEFKEGEKPKVAIARKKQNRKGGEVVMGKEVQEEIAKLDYMWRFCGVPDEYEAEWEREIEGIKQSCRAFAKAIIKCLKQLGYRKLKDKPPLGQRVKMCPHCETNNELPTFLAPPIYCCYCGKRL